MAYQAWLRTIRLTDNRFVPSLRVTRVAGVLKIRASVGGSVRRAARLTCFQCLVNLYGQIIRRLCQFSSSLLTLLQFYLRKGVISYIRPLVCKAFFSILNSSRRDVEISISLSLEV